MRTKQDMMQAQMELEEVARGLGADRYRKLVAQGNAILPPAIQLLKRYVEPLAERIKEWVTDCTSGKPTKNATLGRFLDQFEPVEAAYMVLREVVRGIGIKTSAENGNSATAHALGITRVLEDSLNHDVLKKAHPALYRMLLKKMKEWANEPYRHHLLLRRQQKFAGVQIIKWDRSSQLRLGIHLLRMVEAEGLIEFVPIANTRGETPYYIRATDEVSNWLTQAHARCEIMSPLYMPMVMEPRRWTTPFNGGYLNGNGPHRQFVKGRSAAYMEELKHHHMPAVYAAVNSLQATRWSVNAQVLSTLQKVWDEGGTLGNLPSRENLPIIKREWSDEERAAHPEGFRAYKKGLAAAYSKNAKTVSKRLQLVQTLEVAERMSKFNAIHFVYQMDWRGRIYALGSGLTPQGNDVAKGLLTFADGKPLGDNGAFWLAVQGANTFGIDKVSFDERVQWVEANQDAILDCARNPLDGSRLWNQADSPYCFLAFCFEWAALVAWVEAGNAQEDFLSRLPVQMDGSCNGLQNFSAMLRDAVGGAATNLVPADTPADVYTEVAIQAQALVDADAADPTSEHHGIAQRWIGKMSRKTAKRNTMTVPYGVTLFGMRDQLISEFGDLAEEGLVPSDWTAADALYVAKKNHEAIGQVVVAARRAMNWLHAVAKVVTSDGLPVRWTAPSGFPVVQAYRKLHGKFIDFTAAGERIKLTLRVEGSEIDKRKQTLGIAPNFVHSLDASHLVATVNRCTAQGVTGLSFVHDSFGTHAGDMDVMAAELRAAFVEQYQGDVLGVFRQALVEQLPPELAEKLPPCPPMGSLDLDEVLQSEYFFA